MFPQVFLVRKVVQKMWQITRASQNQEERTNRHEIHFSQVICMKIRIRTAGPKSPSSMQHRAAPHTPVYPIIELSSQGEVLGKAP